MAVKKKSKKWAKGKRAKSKSADYRINAFISAYTSDPTRHGTNAALAAGCPPRSAHQQASDWLNRPEIKARVDAAIERQNRRVEIKGDWILEQLRRIAAFDPRKLYHPNGQPKKVVELDDETATAISGIEFGKAGKATKYRVTDKKGVLELLGKNQRLFIDRQEHSGPEGGPIRLDIAQMTDEQIKAELERKKEEVARREKALGVEQSTQDCKDRR